MPADIFDLKQPRSSRANALVNGSLLSLYKQLAKKNDVGELRIINIAAVNFTSEEPPEDVRLLMSKPQKPKRKLYREDLDASTLDQ
jgi:hypothetical protein